MGCFAIAHALMQGWPQHAGAWWAAQSGLLWAGMLILAWPRHAVDGTQRQEGGHTDGLDDEAIGPRSAKRFLIDRLIILLAILIVFWKTLLEPQMAGASSDSSLAQSPLGLKSLALLFPIPLVAHLFCALMLFSAPRRARTPALAQCGAAMLVLLLCDSVYALRIQGGSYRAGSALDAGWVAAWLLIGLAALSDARDPDVSEAGSEMARGRARARSGEHAGEARPGQASQSAAVRTPTSEWKSRGRRTFEVWLPYAAALGACGVLVGQEVLSRSSVLERIAPILGLVAIVIGRQMMTLSDNVRLSERLRRANRDLERNVNDRTRHLATLHGITSTLNSSLDDQAILHAIIDGVMPAVHAQAGGIWLRDARRSTPRAASPHIRRTPSVSAGAGAAPEGPQVLAGAAVSAAPAAPTAPAAPADAAGRESASIDWGAEWSPAYTQGFDDDVVAAVALRDQAIIAAITERHTFNGSSANGSSANGSSANGSAARGLASATGQGTGASTGTSTGVGTGVGAGRVLPDGRSLILLPIRWQGLLLGAIGLVKHEGEFGYEDRALVESVALEAGTALQNARLFQQANHRADRDPVTALFNHRAMQQTLQSLVHKARDGGDQSFAVLMMDMNNFKFFNDTYGHLAGDDVLRAVARALTTACRASDIVGRYGGDEFVAILPGADAQGAREACARIADELDRHHFEPEPGTRVPISMAFGWAVHPHDGQTPLELTTTADRRLFEGKRNGPSSFLWSLPLWQDEVEKSRASLTRRRASSEPGAAGAISAAGISSTSGALGAEAAQAGAVAGLFGGSFDVLDALVTAIDNKDRYTRRHSEEVTQLALMTARQMGFSPEMLRAVRISGLLHDVGKIAVPDLILRHPGKLGEEEARIMRQHPVFGALIVRDVAHQQAVMDGVRHHHERWDGRGYPDGLCGEAIPWMGRLLAVGDVFSALTTDRPYRKALEPLEALAEIEKGAETQFDPAFVAAFARSLRREMSRASIAA